MDAPIGVGIIGLGATRGWAATDVDLVVVTVQVPEHHRLVAAAIDAG